MRSGEDRWRAALLTGLVSSAFSTLVVHLTARRLGRDVNLSWMEVATVVLGHRSVERKPSWRTIVPGILVHQAADLGWATLFFGGLARWTRRLPPSALVAVAPAWATASSAFEYYVALPRIQPWLRMQTPYWIGLLVHLASAAAYPAHYLVRRQNPASANERAFGQRTLVLLAGAVGAMAVPAALGAARRELSWPAGDRCADREFLRHMTHHHEVGVRLADLAVTRSPQPDIRALGRLMAAEQEAQIDAMADWWASWFGGPVPPVGPAEAARIPGMPSSDEIGRLGAVTGKAFDRDFAVVMGRHHAGAISLAEDAIGNVVDPRARLLAAQIKHAQVGQKALLEHLARRSG